LGLESDSHCLSFTRSLFEDAASDKSRVVTETEPSPHDMDEKGLGEVDLQDLFDGEDADVCGQSRKGFGLVH
jgi:hypothetical protein